MELFLLPIPLAGHLDSMLEMARTLLAHNPNLTITVLAMTTPTPYFRFTPTPHHQSHFTIQSLHTLQSLQPLEACSTPSELCAVYVELHKPHIMAALSELMTNDTKGLVIDFLATMMIDVADELGIPKYVYFTSNAATLMLISYDPVLHEEQNRPVHLQELADDGKVMEVPGLPPIPYCSVPNFMLEKFSSIHYDWMLYNGRQFRRAKGMIVNTFTELEPIVLQALADGLYLTEQQQKAPRVYTAGPVLGLGGDLQANNEQQEEEHECIKWLDEQPQGTVLFLCFGSIESISVSQLKEMAMGLEGSQQRFLLSLRLSDGGDNVEDVLPRGFLERSKGRGLLWPSWTLQVQILAHKAVGGFVTHCGWNSCLEAMWFGVPLLAWPRAAEQHLTAFLLARSWGVAVELRVDRMNENFVSAGELERGIRCLMERDSEEGKRVRRRVEEIKVASRKALEEGGSSYVSMQKFVADLAC